VQYAFANPEKSVPYSKQHAQNMDEQVMKQHIDLYVNRFTVDLGREGERAVRLLFEKAQELKLIPSIMEPLMR
jgi:1,4-dihydroxy-6-naphthoate synthase